MKELLSQPEEPPGLCLMKRTNLNRQKRVVGNHQAKETDTGLSWEGWESGIR